MGRDVPFEHDKKCDACGKLGAFDFMGDYLCGECFAKERETDDDGTGTESGRNAGCESASATKDRR